MEERVSGLLVQRQMDGLRERLGARFEPCLGRLTKEDQDELRHAMPISWVRYAPIQKLYDVAAQDLGTTVEALHTEIATKVVGGTVTMVWRALLKVTSDAMLFSRTPQIFKKALAQGQFEVIDVRPGHAEIRITEWPNMSEFALRGIRLGIESTLRSAGRKNPRGSTRRTADGGVVTIDWST
jgi:hypothetical protein